MTPRNRYFTLLEVMIGISILLMVSGVIGIKLHKAIEKKQFTSHLERLQSRLITCRLMATNMQSDWKGVLYQKKKEWIFESYNVDDTQMKGFRPLNLGPLTLYWEGKQLNRIDFLFAATGEVRVCKASEGTLFFSKSEFKEEWHIPHLFKCDESEDGKKSGPTHPDEIL